ncbi:hypothetical protein JOF53_000519 [Crossiella equi]|uniref:Uncharacterized protein n=1 Tax=Crossiella equi TaxID=130796 RepID=A0ABS5A5Y8_9PSEU|nr:hypothetical protein [Crossiella equi]MBP2471647.1 hypothetical protein [Crossiella equi]
MTTVPTNELHFIATQCADLVHACFDRVLDWTPSSLLVLDEVCAELLAQGPMHQERFELWWKLVGAYTGQVLVENENARWVADDRCPGAYGVRLHTFTARPFTIAEKVLAGEPYKSLSGFADSLVRLACA